MTWLIVIIVVAVVYGIIAVFSGESFSEGFLVGGLGCGSIILQILYVVVLLGVIIALAGWLFGKKNSRDARLCVSTIKFCAMFRQEPQRATAMDVNIIISKLFSFILKKIQPFRC